MSTESSKPEINIFDKQNWTSPVLKELDIKGITLGIGTGEPDGGQGGPPGVS